MKRKYVPTFESFLSYYNDKLNENNYSVTLTVGRKYTDWKRGGLSHRDYNYEVYEIYKDCLSGQDKRLDYLFEVIEAKSTYRPKCKLKHRMYDSRPTQNEAYLFLDLKAASGSFYIGSKSKDVEAKFKYVIQIQRVVEEILEPLKTNKVLLDKHINQIAKHIINSIYMYYSLKSKDERGNTRSQHIGYGSQSSTNFYTDIEQEFDLTKFVELFGEEQVKIWVNQSYYINAKKMVYNNGIVSGKYTSIDKYD